MKLNCSKPNQTNRSVTEGVAQIGNLPYRGLETRQPFVAANHVRRLPIGDTADCQSALRRLHPRGNPAGHDHHRHPGGHRHSQNGWPQRTGAPDGRAGGPFLHQNRARRVRGGQRLLSQEPTGPAPAAARRQKLARTLPGQNAQDPWTNPYLYSYPGKHNQNSYDLYSVGPDGKEGTDDDIGNWTTK